MNARLLRTFLLCAMFSTGLRAEDAAAEAAPKTNMKEVLRARMAEDAKKKAPVATTPAPAKAKSEKTDPPATPPVAAPAKDAPAKDVAAKDAVAKPAAQPATVLPKVEVKKGRITVLDQKIAKQEEDIAREKKNTKSSEMDLALNDSKIAQPLAIFGGDSAQFRKRVASERVELMEAEKDSLEAMKLARTKKEKEELQKQLDELKVVRRELEKSLR